MDLTMPLEQQNIAGTVNRYGKQLLGFIRGKVKSDEDAEDILQEVWYQFSNLDGIEAMESVSGWLYRVARNKITDLFRKKKPEALEDFTLTSDDGEVDFKDILLQETITPEDEFFKKIFWDELMKALDELPEKQRQVFVMNELEDMSLQSIADLQGENLKTIISRKRYAVKALREKLNTLYNDFNNY